MERKRKIEGLLVCVCGFLVEIELHSLVLRPLVRIGLGGKSNRHKRFDKRAETNKINNAMTFCCLLNTQTTKHLHTNTV